MYIESAKTRQARRVRRSSKLLEFARPASGRRIVPQLVLDPVPPEEAGWVGKYLELADHALNNHDLSNPAARPRVTAGVTAISRDGTKVGAAIDTRGPVRRRA